MGRGIRGKIGEGPSRNMYKRHMFKANGSRFKGGLWEWVEWGHGVAKMETIVLEQQLKTLL